MASTFESIEKEITNRKLQPVYLLKGEEAYYLKLLADKFEKSILDESEADFNLSVFYGKDASMEQIMLTAKQYPLMSPYRVVILKEAQMMDKRELSKMERYLLKPLPTTVLVILNNGKDFPQALATKIGKVGNVFDSKKPYDNQVVAWIDSYVKQKGYTIE
ncbi:MAG TPA: DNA polymerase III subunit delta, partial [Candidatus Onthomorpha intestinigallinarum]|nr:DNA polymerase III subunit delta [Candidatus Onthomorpha intestinigallinarum]